MKELKICFFGHSRIEDYQKVEIAVERLIFEHVRKEEYVTFLVGRSGDFDQMVSSAVIRAKNKLFFANSSLTLVLPYSTAEYRKNREAFEKYYDEIILPNEETMHFKSAYRKRNRKMVDMADICVFYVIRTSGGAYQTLKYAEKSGKEIILLPGC